MRVGQTRSARPCHPPAASQPDPVDFLPLILSPPKAATSTTKNLALLSPMDLFRASLDAALPPTTLDRHFAFNLHSVGDFHVPTSHPYHCRFFTKLFELRLSNLRILNLPRSYYVRSCDRSESWPHILQRWNIELGHTYSQQDDNESEKCICVFHACRPLRHLTLELSGHINREAIDQSA